MEFTAHHAAHILEDIQYLLKRQTPVLAAIDGRCGSGKTTLAAFLQNALPCSVIHMDDYYLPMGERQENWMEIPAGNMDLNRLRREVLEPARAGLPVVSRPYRCADGQFLPPQQLPPQSLLLVEGSYSLHPLLRDCYHYTIFLTCSPQIQQQRLAVRNPQALPRFQSIWIPLEERYFRQFAIPHQANRVVETDLWF